MERGISELLAIVDETFEGLPDGRTGKNTTYTIKDAAQSAFSVFFMQSPSFLAHQRDLQRKKGENNARNLFGIEEIPTDPQIRNLLDPIEPSNLHAPYWQIYAGLEAQGHLEKHRGHKATLLCSLDGTYYFSSQKIHCDNCTQKTKDDKTYYSHSAITPVLVAPDQAQVITLEPEFITPQDGHDKQDCEQNAAKRWVERNAKRFKPHRVTILADDLHAHQPFCELLVDHHFNFILTCKPDSHPTLFEDVELLTHIDGVSETSLSHWNGRFREVWHCRYVNHVPLRKGEDALYVNWCEVTITRASSGQQLFHNSYITNFTLAHETVQSIVTSGRARWKVENENNNVLKQHGYHLEHNFGHGKQYLSAILVMLNLLAFLFHTVLHLTSQPYRLLRQELVSRITFFNDIRALTRYLLFSSWDHLLSFMLERLELDPAPD